MSKRKKKEVLNFVDLFAGAGGLSCGLEMAGFNCLMGVDHNKHAMKTFARNHKNAEAYCGDISKLTKAKLKEYLGDQKVDLIVGGPPCQGFSTVGPGNPDDIRNKLFLEFLRIVKELRPNYLVLENVTGLLARKNEKTLKSILARFSRLGYRMEVRVLESQHYGVPEKRKRTIFIGSRINNDIIFPKITHDAIVGKSKIPAMTVSQALKSLTARGGKTYNHDVESAAPLTKVDLQRIKKIPEGKGIRYEKDEKTYFPPKLRLGVDWKEMRENRFRQTKYNRLDGSKPSPTIMTHRHTYYHPTEHRFLTQREAAAIQSFPNNFVFEGPLSAQWRQIGNAVPPKMAQAIGNAILEMYEQAKKPTKKAKVKKAALSKTIEKVRSSAFRYSEKEKKSKAKEKRA